QPPSDEFIGAGACFGPDIPRVHELARRLIDESELYRSAGRAIDELQGWPRIAGDLPFVAHLGKRLNHERYVPALSGENVFMAVWTGLIQPSFDQLIFFQMFQPIGQRGVCDAGRFAQIFVPGQAKAQIAQDQHRPAVTDGIQYPGNRADHSIKTVRPHPGSFSPKFLFVMRCTRSRGSMDFKKRACAPITLIIRVTGNAIGPREGPAFAGHQGQATMTGGSSSAQQMSGSVSDGRTTDQWRTPG